ncbi:uncharacterized protein LOC118558492 [Fundulus heteroclitus]|uniref:uncharacterized protein LOC118558492 n=1 Tax=Fundulus heteroclitus TaxID=8078 RepID=UPI00165B8F14|nr:uncharacterized protein LOC118558492 [Fundulus heteroclitus]
MKTQKSLSSATSYSSFQRIQRPPSEIRPENPQRVMSKGKLVDPAASSCTEGDYLPRFLTPTPEHGAQFYSPVNQAVKINIRAATTHYLITELLYSGPYNVVKSSSGSGNFSLTWTPSAGEDGQSHPICFVVQASSVYQSELRCVIVTVGKPPRKTYRTVMKLNISTALSPKDDHDKILQAMKDELIAKGFPPDITLHLLSMTSEKDLPPRAKP